MKLLVATHNIGKLKEFEAILKPRGYTLYNLDDYKVNMDGFEETGETFAENAMLKAHFVHALVNMPVISDDSGLMIDALPDILGVKSARFMGEDTDYKIKNQAILDLLSSKEDRSAAFYSAIAVVGLQGDLLFEGQCDGHIAHEILGDQGFGYDPIFVPNQRDMSFAQMGDIEKNKISHRALALEKFVEYLNEKED